MEEKKILAIRDFIESAEKSIRSAKRLLGEVLKQEHVEGNSITLDTDGLTQYKDEDNKIIEGVFAGEDMLGSDTHKYPVPANYASKSKLVQGDKLKLTILPNGKMLYKQILPIERETKIGLLAKENGRFQAVVEGKVYNLLTAAVTHFRGEVGDSITIILPKGKEATYAAVETIIPKDI